MNGEWRIENGERRKNNLTLDVRLTIGLVQARRKVMRDGLSSYSEV